MMSVTERVSEVAESAHDGDMWDDEYPEQDVGTTGADARRVEDYPGQANTSEDDEGSMEWGELAAQIAFALTTRKFSPKDLAELRGMDPGSSELPPAYWNILVEYNLLGSPQAEQKWAVILNGMALMTIGSGDRGRLQSAHDGHVPVGRALYIGGTKALPHRGFYSEKRLSRLLRANGKSFQVLLRRMFRMMRSGKQSFNWREMSRLILAEGYNERSFDTGRRRVAREYYRAKNDQRVANR